MKLYNLYNEIILEEISNFKTWISGVNNITKTIIDMLSDDNAGVNYYANITYPNDEGNNVERFVIITQYGISKNNNPIIRVLEVNNGKSDGKQKSKTYNINKIGAIKVSKIKIYDIPDEFKSMYGDINTKTNPNNPFKNGTPLLVAKFGNYKYADSTLKSKKYIDKAKTNAVNINKDNSQADTVEPVNDEPKVDIKAKADANADKIGRDKNPDIEDENIEDEDNNENENNLINKI